MLTAALNPQWHTTDERSGWVGQWFRGRKYPDLRHVATGFRAGAARNRPAEPFAGPSRQLGGRPGWPAPDSSLSTPADPLPEWPAAGFGRSLRYRAKRFMRETIAPTLALA